MDEVSSTKEDFEDEDQAISSCDQLFVAAVDSLDTVIIEDKSMESTMNHSANVAFYVRDKNTGKVYGLTNRHVALQTDKIDIKMISDGKFFRLGTTVKILDEKCLDIGLIEIDPHVKDQLINKENVYQRVCIYSGPFESIFEREIFKYRPNENVYEVSKYDTPNYGMVVTESEHKESNAENGQFFVKNEDGVFSVEGESGTAIAMKRMEDSILKLVGIICGGSGNSTVCLFLPTVFQTFEESYGFSLELYQSEYHCRDKSESSKTVVNKGTGVELIPYGIKIYFICLTPEEIAPHSFDLVEHALSLMCLTYRNVDLKILERLIKKGHALSLLVSKRRNMDDYAIFENDRPDLVALVKGIQACDSLYQGRANQAEKNLKDAILGVKKLKDSGLRLFCKVVTYITWYCLLANTKKSLSDMKTLLEDGIDIFECDFKSSADFPLESIGYLYFDYSRYYMTMLSNLYRQDLKQSNEKTGESYRLNAVEKANKSVTIFDGDHNEKKSEETLRRLVLAKCQHVYALLGCGHDFNFCEEVTKEEITEAESIIKSMEGVDMKEIPLVQNVDYLIALCDLQYRKGETSKALKTACKCLKQSEIKKYSVGFNIAKCRVKMLSALTKVQYLPKCKI